jgi:hypothetical protein
MEWLYQTATLYILIVVLIVIYLMGGIVYFIQMSNISRRITKRKHKVDILSAQKYDVLRMVGKLFLLHHIDIPQELILSKRPKFADTLQNIKTTERKIVASFLLRTAQALFYYGEQNKDLSANQEYIALKVTLSEVDQAFQQALMIYNADAMGFNYWRRFLWYRWLGSWMQLQQRDLQLE